MPVHVAEDPLTSVALGAGRCVEEFEALQQVLVSEPRRFSVPRLDPSRGPWAAWAVPWERRWGTAERLEERRRPRRGVAWRALVLACLSLMVLDHQGGDSSPLEPARRAVGEVFGPVEAGTTAALRALRRRPRLVPHPRRPAPRDRRPRGRERQAARREATTDYDRNRLAAYEGLTTAAADLGYALVPARVIGVGPAQSSPRRSPSTPAPTPASAPT